MQTQQYSNSKKSIETILLMISAFLCYTAMYAVRKSFLAGQYLDLNLGFKADAKTVLVISQVLGYMCSKFIGIKLISELSNTKRISWLVSLITFGLLMLLAFAWLPDNLKFIALFFNGLPLGMVFGIVFSYLEGRKNTELLAAALSATFIFSTGFIKTTGVILMQKYNVEEYFMPFATGLIFFPIFLISVWLLSQSKNPDSTDIQERSERKPMNKTKRKEFFKKYGFGYLGLVFIYILLTIVRDFRDNFIVEFWSELGYKQEPELITLTEIPVAITVLIIAALGVLIRKNLLAFNTGMLLTIFGGIVMILATFLFQNSLISPVIWMVSTGVGVYLPYILFHCLVLERLLALLKYNGNVGFLFYTADSLGYLGSVLILIFKESLNYKGTWTNFFEYLNFISAAFILVLAGAILLHYNNKNKIKANIEA